eukprot:TRINITY_DN5255_c0_g2_i2.p1 TRINITY_DN5255_c0_g2~~TRINITY_DN5255_c0_g2_i2.p1  ORF type:complete len:315 (-),score=84.72 TRINITY_DN5255_c0_g2_i2:178-1122(-)
MNEKFDNFEREKYELLQNLHKKERNLNKKRSALANLQRRVSQLTSESERLRQINALYTGRNNKGLRKLSLDNIGKLEKQLLRLLDAVKMQKCVKTLAMRLSKGGEPLNVESLASLEENLGDLLGEEGRPSEGSMEELSFDSDFFEPKPGVQSRRGSVLKAMERDGVGESVNSLIQSIDFAATAPTFDSFQNYFNIIYKNDRKEFLENKDIEQIDSRVAKLRGSYEKIIARVKSSEEPPVRQVNLVTDVIPGDTRKNEYYSLRNRPTETIRILSGQNDSDETGATNLSLGEYSSLQSKSTDSQRCSTRSKFSILA